MRTLANGSSLAFSPANAARRACPDARRARRRRRRPCRRSARRWWWDDGAPGHLVDRRGVGLQPARGAVVHRLVRQEPVPRHEDVLDHQVLLPVPRARRRATRRRCGSRSAGSGSCRSRPAAVLDDRATQERPGSVVTARGPVPRAVTRYPPSTTCPHPSARTTTRSGARSSPHTSSCACWSNSARCQLCTPMIELTQPVEPQALAMPPDRLVEQRRIALQAAPLLGLQKLEEAGLVESSMVSSGNRRRSSVAWARFRDQRQQNVDAV